MAATAVPGLPPAASPSPLLSRTLHCHLPSFFKPLSSFSSNRRVGFSSLRWVSFPAASDGVRNRKHGWLAFSAPSEGGECERDQKPTASDGDSGATIDLKLPRRRLLVQFTCNECGERTSRLVNPLAYERGLVFVQCAGCLRHHKLVDNLGLIVEYDLREEANVRTDLDQDIIS